MTFTDVANEVNNLASKLTDIKKIAKAGEMAEGFIRSHICAGPFKPLSEATAAYRGFGQPLQASGSLRDSFTFELVNSNTVSVGTTVKYAAVHNNGATIRARKNWLYIPAHGTRRLERKYGKTPGEVLGGLRADDYWVYRIGRTVVYRKKSKRAKAHIVYYLKKSVVIPKREFFYLTEKESEQISKEILNEIF